MPRQARHDAFLDGGSRCMQRIFDARLLRIHPGFGGHSNLK
jgi:hypothetical protein